ncbi:hypothetical protein CC1G_05042 [Coprinopsis cinerea okayama7|uniref:F-box domain-containing protein n=1 Tax=Coprinopsis cinerea (strain Okayama-7 / 130 / ATCC MYA-4618 / FGSC 9003) TaxID=240176 RepID=A8NSN2_COPC7|nr:hypothetical protein CC1G_05042 [Coprinopsis cinerea okayama7\|eukprot:XP_001836049.2 hypothetical protein CC1G_05042 [Coprinopsis cinerea okayama7\
MSMITTISQLPDEILAEMAEYVRSYSFRDEGQHLNTLIKWCPTTLDNCCLVSKRFHTVFLPLRYSSIHICAGQWPRREVSILIAKLRAALEVQPQIGLWIRELMFTIDYTLERKLIGIVNPSSFLEILNTTTALTAFRLSGRVAPSWEALYPLVPAALRKVFRQETLKSVTINTRLLHPILLCSSPSLSTLNLVGNSRASRPGASQFATWRNDVLDDPPCDHPNILSLSCEEDIDILPLYFDTCPLAFRSLQNLKITSTEPPPLMSALNSFLRLSGKTLRMLDIDFGQYKQEPRVSGSFLDLSEMKNLRQVRLRYFYDSGRDLEDYEAMLMETLKSIVNSSELRSLEVELEWYWDSRFLGVDGVEVGAAGVVARLPAFLQALDSAWARFTDNDSYRSLERIYDAGCVVACPVMWLEL